MSLLVVVVYLALVFIAVRMFGVGFLAALKMKLDSFTTT